MAFFRGLVNSVEATAYLNTTLISHEGEGVNDWNTLFVTNASGRGVRRRNKSGRVVLRPVERGVEKLIGDDDKD